MSIFLKNGAEFSFFIKAKQWIVQNLSLVRKIGLTLYEYREILDDQMEEIFTICNAVLA
jgi:hypothetical protein